MIIAIPKEVIQGEQRVAASPQSVRRFLKKGFEVHVQSDAGQPAAFCDEDYRAAGAKIVGDPESLFAGTGVIAKIQGPAFHPVLKKHELEYIPEGCVLIALLRPLTALEDMSALASKKVTAFAMELMPRITRAQQMDVLSAMSSLAGYKAVLLAAATFGRIFPMMTTAAGTLYPAKVLILGAGVAGLQAIATARRLGAVVEAFDTRPAVKEQVESLGATFVALALKAEDTEAAGGYAKALSATSHQQEMALIHERLLAADIVISTALIPGKSAPILITKEMLSDMKTGSVIVDLAAEMGGNCSETRAGETVTVEGVKLIGAVNLAATLPRDASQMYANNIFHFISHLFPDKKRAFDLDDEITKGTCVTHRGGIIHPKIKDLCEKAKIKAGPT